MSAIQESTQTLEDLGADLRREGLDLEEFGLDFVARSIAYGKKLVMAHIRVDRELGHGHWKAYQAEHVPFSTSYAEMFVRFALNEDKLAGVPSIGKAIKATRGLSARIPLELRRPEYDPERVEELRRMGLSYEAISKEIGGFTSREFIRKELNPGTREKKAASDREIYAKRVEREKQREAERKAYEREQQRKLAKRVGGDISVAWADVQKLREIVAKAGELEDQTNGYYSATNTAYQALGEAHTYICRALAEAEHA